MYTTDNLNLLYMSFWGNKKYDDDDDEINTQTTVSTDNKALIVLIGHCDNALVCR